MQVANGLRFEFNPGLAQVSELMRNVWEPPCLRYDEQVLRLHITRPTADPSLALAQTTPDGLPVSFHALVPFDVFYYGQRYKAVFASFLTVARELQGRGVAGQMLDALLEVAAERGYDLYLCMCEEGAPSNRAAQRALARRCLSLDRISVFGYLASLNELLQPVLPRQQQGRTRRYHRLDRQAVTDLLDGFGHAAPLRKVVHEDDVDFVFYDRPCTETFVFEDRGRIRGVVNLLLLEALEPAARLNAYCEHVEFSDMTLDEQSEFLSDVLLAIQERNPHAVFIPNIGYFPLEPFRRFRFRLAPRRINLYMAVLKSGPLPRGARAVERFCLDVF